jgi:hypothetical protein
VSFESSPALARYATFLARPLIGNRVSGMRGGRVRDGMRAHGAPGYASTAPRRRDRVSVPCFHLETGNLSVATMPNNTHPVAPTLHEPQHHVAGSVPKHPTRALVLLGWFFTRRALRSSSTPRRGSQVRTGPSAGGSRIRTIGPAEDPRRRRDIGSRRAAFSVAARRADTSPSLETLVVSRGTDGSIRLVPGVSQTNSEGCGVG